MKITFVVPNPTGVNKKRARYGYGNSLEYNATKQIAQMLARYALVEAGVTFTPRNDYAFAYHLQRHGAGDIDAPLKPVLDSACAGVGINDMRISWLFAIRTFGHAETTMMCALGDFDDVWEWYIQRLEK